MPRRHVRVDHELFLQLEVLLPEEPTEDLPSQGQFISRDLVLALAEVEERWDELPAISPDGSLRTLILFTMIIGTLQLSRAVTDHVLSEEALAHGLDQALTFLGVEQED